MRGPAFLPSGTVAPAAVFPAAVFPAAVFPAAAGLRSAALALACALALAAAAAPAGAEERLLDEVVAVVDNRSVLLSEVDLVARIERGRAGGAAAALAEPDGEALGAALEQLVNELVLFAEADRLQVFQVTDADVARAVGRVREAVGDSAFETLQGLEAGETTVEAAVRRSLRVQRYLEGRFRLASRPRDSEVLAMARVAAPDGRPGADLVEGIRERLGREKYERLTREFTADVRRRARVRLLRDFGAGGGGTPLSGSIGAGDAAARERDGRGGRRGGG